MFELRSVCETVRGARRVRVKGVGYVLLFSFAWSCTEFGPPPDVSDSSETCCGGQGICFYEGIVSAQVAQRLATAECQEPLLCVPLAWALDPTTGPAGCRAAGDLEGRCLPSCLPELADQADQLQQRTCEPGNVCVPCHDPWTGEDTQACRLDADPGPSEPPRVFEHCCDQAGRCVPEEALPPSLSTADLERLGPDECGPEPGALCVPEPWLQPANAVAETCRAAGDLEGRCLPSCLPELSEQRDQLQQQTCASGQLCVPCYDPHSGEDTRACRLGDDAPREPAPTDGDCCRDAGSEQAC
jgi:hypothetical protein